MDPSLAIPAVEILIELFKRRKPDDAPAREAVVTNVERHLREVLAWSERIQFYGMARSRDVETSTVPLRLSNEPRRFRSVRRVETTTELELLSDASNYVVLGDPGAGKTTTLKRLARRLLLEQPDSANDAYQIPVVIRLRELKRGESISEGVASALGIPYEARKIDSEPRRIELWVGDTRLPEVIADFLNAAAAVLILDGIDEVPTDEQYPVRTELTWFARNVSDGKVVASCRSGDYTTFLEGFDVVELCPLQQVDITTIATAWLGDPSAFLHDFSRVPYRDVADRPLLLTQLLLLYSRYGYLPEQPYLVYRKVVALLLQEWDAERGITRTSRYANFDRDKKAEFLAAIAHHLTCRVKTKVFGDYELLDAYKNVCRKFNLPSSEAKEVIAEIETHTGIIAVSGFNRYEFAHLSLQEYLCADYLVREPHSDLLTEYLASYPAPIAITVAMSSNSSNAFAALFLRTKTTPLTGVDSLLARLLLEKPMFEPSLPLGVAIMKLYRELSDRPETLALLSRVTEFPNVGSSIEAAINCFRLDCDRNSLRAGFARFTRVNPMQNVRGFRTPEVIWLPLSLLERLAAADYPRASDCQNIVKHFGGAPNSA